MTDVIVVVAIVCFSMISIVTAFTTISLCLREPNCLFLDDQVALDVHACHLTEDVLDTNCTGNPFYEDPFDSQGDSQTS